MLSLPTSISGIQIGDTIGFNGFNQTPGAGLSQYLILGGSVAFTPVSGTQSPASPFNGADFNIYGMGQATQTLVSIALSPTVAIPYWQSLVAPQLIVNNGSFQFSISLTVQGPDGSTKTFVLPDPEMVVGSTN